MDDLICNQHSIPADQYRYGLRSSASAGCGWIAVYNALRLLGWRADIEKLIRRCEWQLPLIHGNLGTALWGPALLLRDLGFPVSMTGKRADFDRAAREADACILFYRWRRGRKIGAHFVALRPTKRGFVGYNTFTNSKGPDLYGESLDAFLKKHGYFGAVLTTIYKK